MALILRDPLVAPKTTSNRPDSSLRSRRDLLFSLPLEQRRLARRRLAGEKTATLLVFFPFSRIVYFAKSCPFLPRNRIHIERREDDSGL